MYQAYDNLLGAYPELKQRIRRVLPDLQSPFDNLELIVGSTLFKELVGNPEVVDRALAAVSTAQIALAKCLEPLINDGPDGFSHQHGTTIRGRILLRNDSVTMISPEMYREQIASHDERVLAALGGGAIHSCGRVDAHMETFLGIEGLRCFDFGQSEMNNLERWYGAARSRRIPLVRVSASEEDLVTGKIVERYPTGIALIYRARSQSDAKRVMSAYRRVTEMK